MIPLLFSRHFHFTSTAPAIPLFWEIYVGSRLYIYFSLSLAFFFIFSNSNSIVRWLQPIHWIYPMKKMAVVAVVVTMMMVVALVQRWKPRHRLFLFLFPFVLHSMIMSRDEKEKETTYYNMRSFLLLSLVPHVVLSLSTRFFFSQLSRLLSTLSFFLLFSSSTAFSQIHIHRCSVGEK